MTVLLERESELVTIEALLDSVCGGSGRLLTVEGEAGAGKTALLDAAAAFAEARGMRVLRARGGEFERDFPYGAIRQLFESELIDEEARAELLSGSAGLAAPVFELGDPAQQGEPLAVRHGLYWLLADLAAVAPTVLLVDDAQWVDRASLHAIAYSGRRLEGTPALVALGVRSGEPGGHEALLDELRGERIAERIEPPPLSAGAAASLIAAEIGVPQSPEFAAACIDSTAGNPFLLGELLRSLGPEHIGPPYGGMDRLAEVAAAGVGPSILARLSRLGPHSVAVAYAVAVLEPNAEARLIAALAGLSPDAVAAASELLVRARLLSDSQPVGFVHPLVREAVLSEVPAPRRGADHALAARLLGRDGAEVDTVAAHLMLAECRGDEWAVEALEAAAAGALSRAAPDTAVRYLRRALREPPPPADRARLDRELGVALLRANDRDGIDVLREVRADSDDPVARAELAYEMALSLGIRGRGVEASELLDESLAAIAPAGELGTLLRATLLLMVVWGHERLPADGLPDLADGAIPTGFAGRVLLAQSATLTALGLGRIATAEEFAEGSMPSAVTVEADSLAGLPPLGAFAALALADRGERVAGPFETSLQASLRRGAPLAVAGGHVIRALVNFVDGDLAEAGGDSDIAMRITRGIPLPSVVGVWLTCAMMIATARGDYATAERLPVGPWRERQPPTSGFPAAVFLCARGGLRRETGRFVEARADFLAASERVSWLPLANLEVLPWRTGLALCEAALGNADRGRDLAEQAEEAARRAGGVRGIGIALRVRGAIASGPEAVELLRRSAEALGGTRARLEHARASIELGAALRRANCRRDAREPLREGLEMARRCGAAALEEQARTELAATGARPRRAVYSGVESLTPSELRVARMAAEGLSNREIAQVLTVTAKTVETHLRHVFQKLEVTRRTELEKILAAAPG